MLSDSPPVVPADEPVVIPIEAYTSEAYARAENEKLWGKVWQAACRTEEIAEVGDYVTYDILDESIIVVRTAPDTISAYYNVCQHRGRRLTKGCGRTRGFHCRFHGWAWDLQGKNTFVLDPEDWGEALDPERIRLKTVKVDTWGGWVWINMDSDCEPLEAYLAPATSMLGPLGLDKMRYRWRKWLYFPCNWKTAVEAFNESYHVLASHPQLARHGSAKFWSRGENHCGWHGPSEAREGVRGGGSSLSAVMAGEGQDPRKAAAEALEELVRTLDATTTRTIVEAAERLVDELPEAASAEEVSIHLMQSAARDDAARGVDWPHLDPEHMMAMGMDWHIFPNTIIIPGPTTALCYRARPNGYNPDSCIFEVSVIERFPEGQEPKTEWVFEDEATEERWRKILSQDFGNMPEVQRGMKSRGFAGALPNPVQEVPVIHFHRLLAKYMGTGGPRPLGI
jgi:phenylpropionate dioxygenase-like ring-hydroxylating dioxygenase large terminal subunit